MENLVNYNLTLTREEIKMIRKALKCASGSIRKLMDNCVGDTLSEETCIDILFKYHGLINKIDDVIIVNNIK